MFRFLSCAVLLAVATADVAIYNTDGLILTQAQQPVDNFTDQLQRPDVLFGHSLLDKRQECVTGWGTCPGGNQCGCPFNEGGQCCPSGYCKAAAETCCGSAKCSVDFKCCNNGCIPSNSSCCDDGTYCVPGSNCVSINGNPNDIRCLVSVDLTESTATVPVPTTLTVLATLPPPSTLAPTTIFTTDVTQITMTTLLPAPEPTTVYVQLPTTTTTTSTQYYTQTYTISYQHYFVTSYYVVPAYTTVINSTTTTLATTLSAPGANSSQALITLSSQVSTIESSINQQETSASASLQSSIIAAQTVTRTTVPATVTAVVSSTSTTTSTSSSVATQTESAADRVRIAGSVLHDGFKSSALFNVVSIVLGVMVFTTL